MSNVCTSHILTIVVINLYQFVIANWKKMKVSILDVQSRACKYFVLFLLANTEKVIEHNISLRIQTQNAFELNCFSQYFKYILVRLSMKPVFIRNHKGILKSL